MLYELADLLSAYLSGFSVFRYITLRTILAILTALLVSLLIGGPMIRWLSRYKVGQMVRDDGPQSHIPKAGTPTMGGALILDDGAGTSAMPCTVGLPLGQTTEIEIEAPGYQPRLVQVDVPCDCVDRIRVEDAFNAPMPTCESIEADYQALEPNLASFCQTDDDCAMATPSCHLAGGGPLCPIPVSTTGPLSMRSGLCSPRCSRASRPSRASRWWTRAETSRRWGWTRSSCATRTAARRTR